MTHAATRLAGLAVFTALAASADFTYEQTTKITGGALADMMKMAGPFAKTARDPTKSTVMIKGNKMAHVGKERMSVVDLDTKTITEVNFDKKTYSVMTFAEMKQAFEGIQKRLNPNNPSEGLDYKVDIKETGEKKQINGLEAREVRTTIQMLFKDAKSESTVEVIANSWRAPEMAGYDEVRKFYHRMAESLDWAPGEGSGLAMTRPGVSQGMARLSREGAKLEGVPVLEVTQIMGQGAAGSPEKGASPETTAGSKTDPGGSPKSTGRMADRIGEAALGSVLGGFGRKKQPAPQAQPAGTPAQDNAPSTPATPSNSVLMETTTEMTSYSAEPIAAARFEVPTGFRKVDSDMSKISGEKP